MSSEQNIQIFRRMIEEGFNKGNLGALDELFAPDYQEHQFQLPPTLQGFKESIRGLRTSFPDITVTIEDVIADEDKVWARSTARGTHRGEFMGLPPSGAEIAIDVIDICRFESGKIVEHWGVPDRLAQLLQLGILPQPQPR
jgi:steroid delta-isomerase-like uncharacterized protein